MRGLLLKDLYTLLKQAKVFLLMIVFFAFMPDNSISAFAIVYAAMLPITALAYDERARFDELASMMPYSSRNIVFSKYLLGYIAIVIASILSTGAQYIIALVKHKPITIECLVSTLLIALVATVLLSIDLPLMLKLGVEKGRMAFIAIMVIAVAVGMGGGAYLVKFLEESDVSLTLILTVAVVAALIINVISVLISESIYKKKTF